MKSSVRARPTLEQPSVTVHRPLVLEALRATTHAHLLGRKFLVAPDVNYARELLVTLARDIGGWIGWEATTLKHIADDLAFTTLHARGCRIAGDLEIRALVNRALERAIDAGHIHLLAALAGSLGFRQTLHDSVLELRMAGVTGDDLRHQTQAHAPSYEVAAVLDAYESFLTASTIADPAHVFRVALEAFESEAPYVLDGHIALVPSLVRHGLPGELLGRLIAYGAHPLGIDLPIDVNVPERFIARQLSGIEALMEGTSLWSQLAWLSSATVPRPEESYAPDAVHVDMFAAATPSEELREVFRRIAAEGVRFDDVEIVATDTDTYGIAFDVLCQRLGVGGTMLHGVPLARTRLGRAVERWFTWLDDGLPADVLRQALEAGELATSDDVPAATVARELRTLQIGWGRDRYEAALAVLDTDARPIRLSRHEDETDEEWVARTTERRTAGRALAVLLRTLLELLPPVPERGSNRSVRTSPAVLAAATRTWLGCVPIYDIGERETVERIETRLVALAIEAVDTSFSTALATLRDALSDVRAWPLLKSDRNPWSAAGGMVHLTDVVHAGTTGRRRVFVVGLDADRTAGSQRTDPLLPDSVRHGVAGDRLPTVAQRREERAYLLLASLAALRGRVTLSYAIRGTLDGRDAGPSPVLLQSWRLHRGDMTLSYEQLRAELTPPVSAVPAGRGEALLDARDVWLHAITDGPMLLDGEALVRSAFPSLDTGLRAATIATGESLTAYHGLVHRAAGVLDPTTPVHRAISPSALERLAKCPLAWFYRYGLSIRPPDDPEYDPERWLDAATRGSLLHEVFETFAKRYQHRQGDLVDDLMMESARADALALVDAVAVQWRVAVPPPSETVYASECSELRTAVLTFLLMERRAAERGDAGRWSAFEYTFGDAQRPGWYTLDDGSTLAITGRVDRIDELADERLRVIDYKTGRSHRFAKGGKAAFDGGRQLQPALYASVLETLLGRRVACFEYRFPTERGDHEIVAYTADELSRARPIVTHLLGYVRGGIFVPTTDKADCQSCDYQAICRVRCDSYGNASSPRATWAKANAERLPEYQAMLMHRSGKVLV